MTSRAPVVVVGGGITGLAAAHRLAEVLGPDAVLLLEGAPRLGGKISTEQVEGFVIEGGPDCFLASKPAGVELCLRLGLAERLRGTDPRYRRSYVKRGGRLHELPDGITGLVPSRIGPLLTTPLLSLRGRARAALEILVPPRRDGADESIAEFARRRFGAEAYAWLIEPLLGGIFAGDGEALSLAATFPQLRDAEWTHGAILRLMLRQRLKGGNGAKPLGFVTPERGLAELVAALEERLAGRTRTGATVTAVRRLADEWRVELADGTSLAARAVIVAAPAFTAADLLAQTDPPLAAELRGIPFVSTATVSVAFSRAAIRRPLPGYGYVSPRAEGGSIVACTWTSNKFPARVPEDGVLLRFFVGRAGREDIVAAGDHALKALVRTELAAVHGITAEPALWRIYRWPKGMPQYTVGHRERLARIEQRVSTMPGLALAGASYRGVGIPDCIASGWAAADAVAVQLQGVGA
ncbi:MAG: protoporphyrinogen oxidase [Gemmatimonadota bacterium]